MGIDDMAKAFIASIKPPSEDANDLDFVSVGALVHRLDSGIVPFRKASNASIHVSGGEFNTSANLADCFGLKTAVCSAMVDYPVGWLIHERVKAMGVRPFYKNFEHNGVNGPKVAVPQLCSTTDPTRLPPSSS